jgi:hypothetical protein
MRALVSQPSWWGNPPDAVQRAMNHIALDATSGRLQEGLPNGRAFFTYVNVSFSFSYFSS